MVPPALLYGMSVGLVIHSKTTKLRTQSNNAAKATKPIIPIYVCAEIF